MQCLSHEVLQGSGISHSDVSYPSSYARHLCQSPDNRLDTVVTSPPRSWQLHLRILVSVCLRASSLAMQVITKAGAVYPPPVCDATGAGLVT